MSMHQVNPADHFGANRNLNNYVAKQVVAQALRLNTTPSPTENEQADAAGAPPSREAEPVLVSSTVAPAPVSESEEASPPRQYAYFGECDRSFRRIVTGGLRGDFSTVSVT